MIYYSRPENLETFKVNINSALTLVQKLGFEICIYSQTLSNRMAVINELLVEFVCSKRMMNIYCADE